MSIIPPDGDAARARDALEDVARTNGLYLDNSVFVQAADGTVLLVADFLIGDVAWSTRVQDPDQAEADTAFRQIAVEEDATTYDDLRSRIQRNIAQGRSPFDDEDTP